NYIGLNKAGTAALGNAQGGVQIDTGASGNTIGGPTSGARNVISGNAGAAGISISGAGTTGTVVVGNFIGTDWTGTVTLGNTGAGVLISSAHDNTVGGPNPGQGNRITGNRKGIVVDSGAVRNSLRGNLTYLNVTGTD